MREDWVECKLDIYVYKIYNKSLLDGGKMKKPFRAQWKTIHLHMCGLNNNLFLKEILARRL